MKNLSLFAVLLFALVPVQAAPNTPDVILARGGNIVITPIYHASLQIEYRGTVIHVDPFSAGDYSGTKKADLILITHSHADHLDVAAIKRVMTDDTTIMAPPSAYDILDDAVSQGQMTGYQLLPFYANQKRLQDTETPVESVPAYNLNRGPKPGQEYHPKGQFNGYILTLGGKRIYIAGDTEATPEMKALKNIDVAFLPMNLPYTMTPQEAASGARAFKPKIVFPYHYRYPFDQKNNNPQQFAKALEGSGIEVRIRGWYAHPASPK